MQRANGDGVTDVTPPARATARHDFPTRRRLALRMAPFAGAMALPFATLPLPPHLDRPYHVLAAATLTALIVVTGVFAPWHRLPHFAQVVPPMTFFVVIALLREAQGGATGYTPLAMLPVFWLALYGTRIELAVSIAGLSASFLAPLVLVGAPDYPTSEWRRAVLYIAIAPLVGFTVQRLVIQLRERALESNRRAEALRHSEEEMHSIVLKMAAVTEAMQEISRTSGAGAARVVICEAACKISSSDFAALLEADDSGHLVLTGAAGSWLPDGVKIPIARDGEGAGDVYLHNKATFVPDVRLHGGLSQRIAKMAGAVSAHFEPVVRDDEPLGVLVVGFNEPIEKLSAWASSGLRMLAAEAAIAIERAELLVQLEESARTDDLTGLPNRRAWEEHLPRELARSRREKRPVCVAMLDLDRFKRFNDDRGHQAGDRLLKQSTAAWVAQLRKSDMLARYGGEEFSLVLPGCTIADAEMLVERLRASMPSGQTVSAGVACWDGEESSESLLGRADTALYEAKRAGRDRLIAAR